MPLRNRVDPSGEIRAVAARGLFTGNRGVIHDPETRTLLGRRWTTKAWIICDCGYKARKRDVFGRNARSGGPGWTNLFFLDEPTALAAGHRPCFECRRGPALAFAACFGSAIGQARSLAARIDAQLHAERAASGDTPATIGRRDVPKLPGGAIVLHDGRFLARKGEGLRAWSFHGYGAAIDLSALAPGDIRVMTPPSTLAALAAGYRPTWHPTA